MEDCIFCKIKDGTIPAKKIYEDAQCYAVYDINPKAKTHVLIIPNKHIRSVAKMDEGDEQIIGHLIKVAKKIGEKENLPGYKLTFNVEKHGGQEIFHIHLHLMAD